MQEIESAVRDLGGSAMQGIDHAVKGLNSGTLEGTLPFIIGSTDFSRRCKMFFTAVSSHLEWYLWCGSFVVYQSYRWIFGFRTQNHRYQSADCGVLWNTWLFGGYFMGALRQVKLQAGGKL